MQYDYSGKTVYVGIDVHKKRCALVCLQDRQILKKWSTETNSMQIICQLHKFFPGAKLKTVYEAGYSGYFLHRELVKHGIDNIIVDPGSVEVATNDRVKTDQRDAKKLAIQLSEDRLRGNYIPTVNEEACRLLTRMRETLTKDRTRTGNRIKSKLHQYGLCPPEGLPNMSKKFINTLRADIQKPEALRYTINVLCDQWERYGREIKEVEKSINTETDTPAYRYMESIYRTVPGIGGVSSKILASELGDLQRFSSAKKLYSYTGLTPTEHSSGEKKYLGHISRKGPARIRHILIEIAWRALDYDPRLAMKFAQISKRSNKKVAIVAIARNLIGRVRSCFLSGEPYLITEITSQ